MYLDKEFKALRQWAEKADKTVESVSKKGIHWHVDHCCRVAYGISRSLERSNPEDYKWAFNKSRMVCFAFNHIPRGSAKAPQKVQNNEPIEKEGLFKLLDNAQEKCAVVEEKSANHFFDHAYFGHLNKKNVKKMIKLHTNHHLKIIKDIDKA